MSSAVDIANRALQMVGASRISSFSDDTKEAEEVNGCYASLRDAELETNTWRFSIKRVQLSAMATAPDFGRAYQYQLPSDFICPAPYDPKVGSLPDDYLFEGTRLLTDLTGPLNVRYVCNSISPEMFSPLFVEGLAARVAMEICEALTQSNTKEEKIAMKYATAISKARARNAIISGPVQPATDPWQTSRGTANGGYWGGAR